MIDPSKLKSSGSWKQPGILFDVARDEENDRLTFGSSDFKVYEFDPNAEKPEAIAFSGRGHESYVTSIVRTKEALVSAGYDGRMIWWDPETRSPQQSIDAHAKWIRMLAVSPDQTWIASVADDMVCRIWDAATGKLRHEFRDHAAKTPHHYPSMLYAVAISTDGRLLATGDKTGNVVIRDLDKSEIAAKLETPVMYTWDPKQRRHSIGGIRSLAFSHDGQQLAVGGIGKIGNIDHLGGPHRVEVFRWRENERLHELEGSERKGLVEQLEFHPSGKWLLAAGGDHNGFVTVYDMNDGKALFDEKAPMHVHAFAFNESYDTLYAVGHNRIARWNA